MASYRTRRPWAVVCLALGVGASVASSACGSDSGAANGPTAGGPAAAGAGGMSNVAGTTMTASGAPGAAGAGAGVAGASVAGAAAGGSAGAQGGAASGGAAGNAAAGAGTAGSGSGGSMNCAGNAVSLGANGTGTASDAAHARVVLDLMSDLPIGNAHRTLEFWAYIKPTDWLGEKNEVYVYGSPGTTNTAFGLDFGTNTVTGMAGNHATLNPYTNGSFTEDSTADLGITSAAAQWVHIAMTWDGSALSTYVNGEPKLSKSNGTGMLATTSSVLTMGCNPPIDNCFNGYFDELRVWNVDRSAADIKGSYAKSLKGSEPGLVGYWKFDEAPGAASAADAVTSAGHTAHVGQLMAEAAGQKPTFITPSPPAPILCP